MPKRAFTEASGRLRDDGRSSGLGRYHFGSSRPTSKAARAVEEMIVWRAVRDERGVEHWLGALGAQHIAAPGRLAEHPADARVRPAVAHAIAHSNDKSLLANAVHASLLLGGSECRTALAVRRASLLAEAAAAGSEMAEAPATLLSRVAVAELTLDASSQEAADVLVGLAAHPRASTRHRALLFIARLLVERPRPRTPPIVQLQALIDEQALGGDAEVFLCVADWALVSARTHDAALTRCKSILKGGSEEERHRAIRALLQRAWWSGPTDGLVAVLEHLAEEPVLELRVAAALALGGLVPLPTRELLAAAALGDESPAVRLQGVYLLESIPPATAASLAAAASRDEPDVHLAKCLAELGAGGETSA